MIKLQVNSLDQNKNNDIVATFQGYVNITQLELLNKLTPETASEVISNIFIKQLLDSIKTNETL